MRGEETPDDRVRIDIATGSPDKRGREVLLTTRPGVTTVDDRVKDHGGVVRAILVEILMDACQIP